MMINREFSEALVSKENSLSALLSRGACQSFLFIEKDTYFINELKTFQQTQF